MIESQGQLYCYLRSKLILWSKMNSKKTIKKVYLPCSLFIPYHANIGGIRISIFEAELLPLLWAAIEIVAHAYQHPGFGPIHDTIYVHLR